MANAVENVTESLGQKSGELSSLGFGVAVVGVPYSPTRGAPAPFPWSFLLAYRLHRVWDGSFVVLFLSVNPLPNEPSQYLVAHRKLRITSSSLATPDRFYFCVDRKRWIVALDRGSVNWIECGREVAPKNTARVLSLRELLRAIDQDSTNEF
jgi:hypothetical protein